MKITVIFYKLIKKITKRKMIIDITGTKLTPGNYGKDCNGNGEHLTLMGQPIECCCDECGYMMCCLDENIKDKCAICKDKECPRLL